jgi:hypothetical protein
MWVVVNMNFFRKQPQSANLDYNVMEWPASHLPTIIMLGVDSLYASLRSVMCRGLTIL